MGEGYCPGELANFSPTAASQKTADTGKHLSQGYRTYADICKPEKRNFVELAVEVAGENGGNQAAIKDMASVPELENCNWIFQIKSGAFKNDVKQP